MTTKPATANGYLCDQDGMVADNFSHDIKNCNISQHPRVVKEHVKKLKKKIREKEAKKKQAVASEEAKKERVAIQGSKMADYTKFTEGKSLVGYNDDIPYISEDEGDKSTEPVCQGHIALSGSDNKRDRDITNNSFITAVDSKYDKDNRGLTPTDSYALYLPKQAKYHYGCSKCEWKSVGLCPFSFKAGRGHPSKTNMHSLGICQERKNYLLSFSRGYSKRPTFAEWHKDFLMGKAAYRENLDYGDMQQLYERLLLAKQQHANLLSGYDGELGTVGDSIGVAQSINVDKKVLEQSQAKIKALEEDVQNKRHMWHSLWRDVMKYEDKQLDREQPKKVSLDHTGDVKVTVRDVQRIVAEADNSSVVVDADYETLSEDDDDDEGGEEDVDDKRDRGDKGNGKEEGV